MALTATKEIEYAMYRCGKCGTYYAMETFRGSLHNCPSCGWEKLAAQRNDIKKLERSLAGMRGALKRKKV